jgi:hypothetical protein
MNLLPHNTDICPHCNKTNIDYDETCSDCGEPVIISPKSLSKLADRLNVPYSFAEDGLVRTLTYARDERTNIHLVYLSEGVVHNTNITGTFH